MQVTFNTQTEDLNELLAILNMLQETIRKKQQMQPNNQAAVLPVENQIVQTSQIPKQVVPDYGFNPEENQGVASAISSLVQDLNKEKGTSRLADEGFFRTPTPVQPVQQPAYQQIPSQQLAQHEPPKKTPEKTAGGGRVIPFVDLGNTMGKIFSSDYGTRKEGRRI
ncbi:hypothetical protein HYX19_02950 [Candidatus Woesearchaeota archaeon]|nr:hypothetical protein [Candidatus Woesearchaeota archaeon]